MWRRAIPSTAAALLALAWVLLISMPSSAAAPPVIVEITDQGFSPSTVTIPPSTTVTWVNRASASHGITGEPGVPLDSPLLEPRFTYSYTFHKAGTFAYHESGNAGVKGKVLVAEGAPAPSPTSSAPPTSPSTIPTPPATIPVNPPSPTDSGGDASVSGALAAGGAQPAPPDSTAGLRTSQRSAAGGVGAGPPQTPPLESATIAMGNEWFGDPSFQGDVFETRIRPGATIQWAVQDGLHNIYECGDSWGGSATSCGAANWHSDQVVTAGGTFSRTFDAAGTFYYLCTIHPATMRGLVKVEAPPNAADETPAPTAAASAGSDPDPRPTVAQVAGIPQGGGPPGPGGDSRTIMILIGAAAAFVISTIGFFVGGDAKV